MHFNLWHRCQKPTSKQRSTSCFIIIASQQKLVTLNSCMNSANKAICYAEVINMYSLYQLFNSTPVHNTPQWCIQCTLFVVHKICLSFIFGVLVSVGKKVLCLQCGFKSWRGLRDIDCNYDVKWWKHSLV